MGSSEVSRLELGGSKYNPLKLIETESTAFGMCSLFFKNTFIMINVFFRGEGI
jgi:hypothetical protein